MEEIVINSKSFISVIGQSNSMFVSHFLECKKNDYKIITYKDLFKKTFNIKNKLSSYINNTNILILDNVLSELDINEYKEIIEILKTFKNNGGIIINITNNIEETLLGDKIIIVSDNKIICDGSTISVLNEEKLLKSLGLGLPFIVELNKYFMDYGMINNYYLTNKLLVGALWK